MINAVANRKKADQCAADSADFLDRVHLALQGEGGGSSHGSRGHDCRGISRRKHESDGERALSFLHELAHHVIDRDDVIVIRRVPQSKTTGQKGRTEQKRVSVKSNERPYLGGLDESAKQYGHDNHFYTRILPGSRRTARFFAST